MSEIVIPYAFADASMSVFKQVNYDVFTSLKKCKSDIADLLNNQMKQVFDVDAAVREKEQEIRQKAVGADKCYNEALERYEEFRRKHWKVFDEKEQLEDRYAPNRLSWIIFGRTREEVLKQHMKKYSEIFKKSQQLYQEIKLYEPYIRLNLKQTIMKETESVRAKLENNIYKQRQLWFESRDNKLRALRQQAAPYSQFMYFVTDLHVDMDSDRCIISCRREYFGNLNGGNIFKQTLINKQIQITH